MAKKSRDKGSRVEREVVAKLQEHGLEARRIGYMYCRGPDIQCEGYKLEVKALAGGWKTLHKWLERDRADALVLKANNKPMLIVMRLDDLLAEVAE